MGDSNMRIRQMDGLRAVAALAVVMGMLTYVANNLVVAKAVADEAHKLGITK